MVAMTWIILGLLAGLHCRHMIVTAQNRPNTTLLKKYLVDLFSKERNFQHSAEWERVRRGIHTYLAVHGGEVNQQEFPFFNGTGVNYATTFTGSGDLSKENITIIGAHYDSQIHTPGVDDNGSGMVSLFELTRLLALANKRCDFKGTVIIVAFDLEEFGLVGSKYWVDNYLGPWMTKNNIPADNVAAFIMDTVMNWDPTPHSQNFPVELKPFFPNEYKRLEERNFTGHFIGAYGRQDEAALLDYTDTWWRRQAGLDGQDLFTVESLKLPFRGNPLDLSIELTPYISNFVRSDHANFWTYSQEPAGLKAVFFTDTADFRGNMRQCYHNPCDDLSYVESQPGRFEMLSKLTDTLFGMALDRTLGGVDPACFYYDYASASSRIQVNQTALLLLLSVMVAACVGFHSIIDLNT